jgi:hypothetical protein
LRRDFQTCIEYADPEVRQYGLRNQKLADAFIDKYRERKEAIAAGDDVRRAACQAELDKLQEELTESAKNGPSSFSKAKNNGVRFTEFPSLYPTCNKYPEVEPTNNAAERAVRPVAIARRVNISSESLHGTTMCNIMRSIYGTCNAKGVNPHEFIVDDLNRSKRGGCPPSLVNIGKAVDQKYVAQAEQERKDLDDANRMARRTRKAEMAQTREKLLKESKEKAAEAEAAEKKPAGEPDKKEPPWKGLPKKESAGEPDKKEPPRKGRPQPSPDPSNKGPAARPGDN